jgi:hypothetical protein
MKPLELTDCQYLGAAKGRCGLPVCSGRVANAELVLGPRIALLNGFRFCSDACWDGKLILQADPVKAQADQAGGLIHG